MQQPDKPRKRVRIKDIAAKAGVSEGTVDRVIHERGKVAPEVRAKVLKVMEELGYERNLLASALAYNRTFRIVALLPDYNADPYWAQPYEGMLRAYKSVQHYGLELETMFFGLFDAEGFLHNAQKALESSPAGILFPPLFLKEARWLLAACEERGIPNVMINTLVDNPFSLSYIGQDSYQSGVLAARLLNFGLGKGESALILNLEKSAINAQHLLDKEQGFRDYFAGHQEKHIRIIKEDFEEFDQLPVLRAFMLDLLNREPTLSGIFVTNSRAYKVINSLEPLFTLPFKIVGFDLIESNLRYLQDNKIDFLINQNPVEQGFRAITALFTHLILKESVAPAQYLPLDIVVTENVQYYLQRQASLHMVV